MYREDGLRTQAMLSLRIAILILSVPAAYNYLAFDAHAIRSSNLPSDIQWLYRTINLFAFVVAEVLLWTFGLRVLESMAALIRTLIAKNAAPSEWQKVLHRSMRSLAFLAVPGAVLWMMWVYGLYEAGVSYLKISWIIGVPAHLLTACWYLPLIYQWYQLAKAR